MGETTDPPRGMSAAQASKPVKPAKKKAHDAGKRLFTIKRDGQVVMRGTFHEVRRCFRGSRRACCSRASIAATASSAASLAR